MLARITITALLTLALAGQDVPKQDAQEAPAKASPIFEYDGKPITIPYHCSLDDIKWAGMTCSEDEACPMYLELASADAVGDHVFAAGNIHSDAVTLYSVLLTSGDGGHTWQMGPDSVRGAGLDHMQFLDALTGWISGQTLFPIPQDPFLLQTTDGGKTWSLKPIFTENHFGSIQQFTFDSKTSGAVVVDNGPGGDTERYTRLESSDGGSTWMLKEENRKSIPLKRAAAASTWRVRADASTRSYRIEHKTGNQWTAVAAFAVKLPACKPE